MAAMGNTANNQLYAACSPWGANGSSDTEEMSSLLWKTHFNIILQSTPRSLKWSLPFRFSDKNSEHTCHFCQAPHIPPQFHHPYNIWWWVQIMKFFIIIQFSQAFSCFLSHSPNIHLATMFYITPNQYSSTWVTNQTSHAHTKEQQQSHSLVFVKTLQC